MSENTNNTVNNGKKKYILQIVLVSLFAFIIVGTSLAIFLAKGSGSLNNITTNQLVDITYSEGSTLRLTNNLPIFPEEVDTKASEFSFTVTNPNSKAVYTTIDLTNITMTSVLKNYDFKWALYDGSTKVVTGSFIDAPLSSSETFNLGNNLVISANASKTYKIRIWLNETGEVQNFQGSSFNAKVKVTAYSKKLKTLNSKILSETVKTTAPNFTTTSTDKGLFVQKDDIEKSEIGFPTYYYRGAVTNNYVSFGTYKSDVTNYVLNNGTYANTVVASAGDPILWRIVRINEDGSIRLISEHNAGGTETWNSTNVPKYINDDGTDSEIKNSIETWYSSKISESNLTSKIQTSAFCNDISGIDFTNLETITPGNAYNRLLVDLSPIFVCPQGAISVQEKVGLLTADELIYSGALITQVVNNNPTYLSNNTSFWTMTPFISNAVYNFLSNGIYISGTFANASTDVAARPVINLKSNVLVKSGDGTKDNPYIIR